MMPRDREAFIVAAALTSVGVVLLSSSLGLVREAATVPIVVAVPTVLVLIGQLVREASTRGEARPDLKREERSTLMWMGVLLGMMWGLGVAIAVPLFLALYMRVRSRERWSTVIGVAAVATGILVAGVGLLLGVQPPPGAIWMWWQS